MLWDSNRYQQRISEIESEFHRKRFEQQLESLKQSSGQYDKIIEKCQKHIKLDREIGKILRKFFDQLELKGYLQETKPLRMMAGVMARNTVTIRILRNIGNPYLSKNNSPLKELLAQKEFGEHAFLVLYVSLVVHLWFDQTEFIKNMLLTMLNKNARMECGIKDSDTLGELFDKLRKKIFVDDFRRVVKPEFRNAIGHSKWWIQKDMVCYQNKHNQIISIHKLEFEMYSIHLVTLTSEFFSILHEYHLMP